MFDRFLLLVDPVLIVVCLGILLIVIAGIAAYRMKKPGILKACEVCDQFSDELAVVKNPDPESRPRFLLACRGCRDNLEELSKS